MGRYNHLRDQGTTLPKTFKELLKSAMKSILTLAAWSLLVMKASSYSCPEVNVDFYGADLEEVHGVTSWQNCGQICELISNCAFWTLNSKKATCYTKSSDGGLRHQNGHISGVRGCK